MVAGDRGIPSGGRVMVPGRGLPVGKDDGPGLAAFQAEVARLFFALPESSGFLLAGGAALLAQHLTGRPTEDLDFFTAPDRGHVPAVRDALEEATRKRGWNAERIHDSDTFCRLVIRSDHGTVLVDLAVNAPPDDPPSVTEAGPTLAPEELAGHKLLALFDRAAARDFADVYVLARGSARTPSWPALPRLTQASTAWSSPQCLPHSTGSPTPRYPSPTAPRQPSSGPSTPPGNPSCPDKPSSGKPGAPAQVTADIDASAGPARAANRRPYLDNTSGRRLALGW
jgi:hypothetical protein